jgi:hypothetical protein
MFKRGLELEKFRAMKIAQYVWGHTDDDLSNNPSDGPDLKAKQKAYGSGKVVTR